MKKTAIIIGILFLIQFVLGVLLNQFLIGPITFDPDYLVIASANTSQLIIGTFISILSGALTVWIAVKLFPFFKPFSHTLALLYVGFSVVSFTVTLIDIVGVLSLLSVSIEYTNPEMQNGDFLKTIGTIFYAIRVWTHYLVLLIAALNLTVFYSALFISKLLPRFISTWGLLAVSLMLAALILNIFDVITFETEMMLFLPLAINQLVLIAWLLIKGFSESNNFNTSHTTKLDIQ